MLKVLYILTSGYESRSLRLGKKLFNNKEIIFNTPEEAIQFINDEQPNLIAISSVTEGDSIFDTIKNIDFTEPVKSISFISKKVPTGCFNLLLHDN